jgi:hypothetical protein
MLKVTITETRDERRLVLAGTLVQPWIAALEAVWRDPGDGSLSRKLIVDLNDVTTISKEGQDTLLDMMKHGARFSCGGILTRYLLKQLAVQCRIKLRDVMDQSSRAIETQR